MTETTTVHESTTSLSPAIDEVMRQGIAAGVFPGGVVRITQGGTVLHHRAYGYAVLYRDRRTRLDPPIPTTTRTIYDLASLTKVVATTTAVMQLVDRGLVDLDAPAAAYLPPLRRRDKRGITVRQLLKHTGGLAPFRLFYRRLHGLEEIVAAAARSRPVAASGQAVIYSDIGFILLGALVTAVSGLALDRYVTAHICRPLGMPDTRYAPPAGLRPRIAATEDERGRGMVWGAVHDENAAAMGGVSGHAGLFGTAADLDTFTAMLLNGGSLGAARILRPETVRAMFQVQTGTLEPARGLGWQVDAPTYMGALSSPHAIGHTGFTGTSIVLVPAQRLSVIMLTNRVHPRRDGPDLMPYRAAVATAVAANGCAATGVLA